MTPLASITRLANHCQRNLIARAMSSVEDDLVLYQKYMDEFYSLFDEIERRIEDSYFNVEADILAATQEKTYASDNTSEGNAVRLFAVDSPLPVRREP